LRKFALVASAYVVLLFAAFAQAQQIDVAVGGSTLFSTKNTTASEAFPPPAEKGGTYAGFSIDRIFENHFGYSAEVSTLYHQGLYNGYQRFRPFLYDVNGVFTHHVRNRINADFMAGVGGESLIFYNQFSACKFSSCPVSVNSNHLLVHVGADVRYTVWRNFFVRPEAHFYRIVNNTEFHSGNVLRLGASIGYTFGSE